MKKIVLLLAAGLTLAACDPKDLPPASVADICTALIGPIKYNSSNPASKRYAAYLLAMDLHDRNEVGRKLNCPQYKKR